MRIALLFLLIGAAAAVPAAPAAPVAPVASRIVGGSVTTIENYPQMVATLVSRNLLHFYQGCGGSILNQRNILTAAHCFDEIGSTQNWRARVGSSFAHSGGVVHNIERILIYPLYHGPTFDNDVAIMRTSSYIQYNNAVRPGSIAGPNYNVADNAIVWATGWGLTEYGWSSEQLRHVQVWTVNQARCRQAWNFLTDSMLCSGWMDVGGRDQCGGDSGGPLYHNGIIVGVCSFGPVSCGSATHPGVNARVSRFTHWITANAN